MLNGWGRKKCLKNAVTVTKEKIKLATDIFAWIDAPFLCLAFSRKSTMIKRRGLPFFSAFLESDVYMESWSALN